MNAIPAISPAGPVNIEAEQALLGAILLNNDALQHVGPLKPEHFAEPIHGVIYQVARDMIQARKLVSPITIRAHLPAADIDMAAYLARLAAEATSIINAADFARIIRADAHLRAIVAVSHEMADASLRPGAEPATIIAEAETSLYEIAREGNAGSKLRARAAGALGAEIIAGIDNPGQVEPPLPTGLVDLDRILGGLHRGNLIILAGRPGMLKTTLASEIAINIAAQGDPVYFFCSDMPQHELTARMLSSLAYDHHDPITYGDVIDGRPLSALHKDMLRAAQGRLRNLPIVIDPAKGLSIPEIVLKARRWTDRVAKDGMRPGLIVYDHLGKIRGDRRDQRHLELGEMTNAFVDLSGELDCPVLLLCQLNRGVESRDNKRPTLADLRESGRIEEDASMVLALYREAYYLAKTKCDDPDKDFERVQRLAQCANELDCFVLKNRNRADGVARLYAHAPAGVIRNAARTMG